MPRRWQSAWKDSARTRRAEIRRSSTREAPISDRDTGWPARSTTSRWIGDADPQRAAIRVGRLVGVLLKASFATSHELDGPSVHTSAFR
jgi:hypothetical protein